LVDRLATTATKIISRNQSFDVRKAFDTLDWEIIFHVLRAFSFNETFCNWMHNIICLKDVFKHYDEYSSQPINFSKSNLYPRVICHARSVVLANEVGLNLASIPFQHPGVRIFQGKPKKMHFRDICDKFKIKLATWKSDFLSNMGRV